MSRENIGYRGYVGKQLNRLRVISSKTASAKESFTMSAVREDFFYCSSCSAIAISAELTTTSNHTPSCSQMMMHMCISSA